jgi:hypothetical protein
MVKTQLKLDRENLLNTLSNPEEFRRLRNLSRPKMLQEEPWTPDEQNMADWLGRLKLLHGVPFNYIVPDVSMLPMESIRFFYCDSIWLDYLTEGALSLGRSTSGDSAHDKAFLGDLHVYSRFGVRMQRSKVLGHLTFHLNVAEKTRLTASTGPIKPTEKIIGFLLRSGVVSGWEGLQVEAFLDDDRKQPSQLLRMDHLSPNVLLCMYEGMVKAVTIHEYPEVLHFGVDASGAPITFSKSFRYIVDHDGHPAGDQVPTTVAPPLQMADFARAKSAGVLRMNDLANAMHAELKDKIAYGGPFTAAEFALEMVEGVEAVNFKIDIKTS